MNALPSRATASRYHFVKCSMIPTTASHRRSGALAGKSRQGCGRFPEGGAAGGGAGGTTLERSGGGHGGRPPGGGVRGRRRELAGRPAEHESGQQAVDAKVDRADDLVQAIEAVPVPHRHVLDHAYAEGG